MMICILKRLSVGVVMMVITIACSHEEEYVCEQMTQALSFRIADAGYQEEGKNLHSRAIDTDYQTRFSTGDACGLYVVTDNGVVGNNIKLLAERDAASGSVTWKSDVLLSVKWKDAVFFLYYPYQEDMKGKVADASLAAESDEAFFAPLIADWKPQDNQSTYAAYTASDLMTARGTVSATMSGEQQVSFSLKHRMALAVVELPVTTYRFTNYTDIPDYSASMPVSFSGNQKMYALTDGTLRLLVRPEEEDAPVLEGLCDDGMKKFSINTANITSGLYKTFKVDGGRKIQDYTLQMSDVLAHLGNHSWYVIPYEAYTDAPDKGNAIGVVIKVGRHNGDCSDYTQPLAAGGPLLSASTFHGYAAALNDLSAEQIEWGPSTVGLPNYPVDAQGNPQNNYNNETYKQDWSGYAYTQAIIKQAGGQEQLLVYPAVYRAVTAFENKYPAPVNTSGWFLPSIGQLWNVYSHTGVLGVVQNELSTFGHYWSSSVHYYQTECILTIRIQNSLGDVYGKYPTNIGLVRPVLAF